MKFLLVDKVERIEPGKRIVAVKNLSLAEEYLADHFPAFPVMPGVMMLEALAQASALLSFDALDALPDDKMIYYFAGMEGVRFRRPVEPGDQLILEAQILRMKAGIFKFKTRALVGTDIAVEAELTCAMRSIK